VLYLLLPKSRLWFMKTKKLYGFRIWRQIKFFGLVEVGEPENTYSLTGIRAMNRRHTILFDLASDMFFKIHKYLKLWYLFDSTVMYARNNSRFIWNAAKCSRKWHKLTLTNGAHVEPNDIWIMTDSPNTPLYSVPLAENKSKKKRD
jgi:hypothetical protein